MHHMKTNIIIPLNGEGTRFQEAGFQNIKPFVKLAGKDIIDWLLESLDDTLISYVIIPYTAYLDQYNVQTLLAHKYPKFRFIFVPIHFNTLGALETLQIALDAFVQQTSTDDPYRNAPLLSLDSDTYYKINIVEKFLTAINGASHNVVFVFADNSNDNVFSYVKPVDDAVIGNKIDAIAEKVRISDFACTGAYGFSSTMDIVTYANQVLQKKENMQKGEFYISCLIKKMLDARESFIYHLLEQYQVVCLGTPLQAVCAYISHDDFLKKKPIGKGLRICFDFDNTLVTHPIVSGDYTSVMPIQKNIDYARSLKNMGHTIIIYTARRMRTSQGCIGKSMADIGKITFDTIHKYNIPCDEIYFGKPYAHFYIDDLAISANTNLEKAIGLYAFGGIPCRDFHNIDISDNIVTKSCNDRERGGLRHQIRYLENIPNDLRKYFPEMISCDLNAYQWYTMERVKGVTFSELYTTRLLSIKMFEKLLNSLSDVHMYHTQHAICMPSYLDVYKNYQDKLISRVSSNPIIYSKYPCFEELKDLCLKYLNDYQNKSLAVLGMLHGDPVFTNIMLTQSEDIKFIDMRGEIGGESSIFGDIIYDYAKVYQSIVGYDEILNKTQLPMAYRKGFVDILKEHVTSKFGLEYWSYVQIITLSLLLALLPLHETGNRDHFVSLAKHIATIVKLDNSF